MPILVVMVLAPTLTFYFYALVQFWMEARRRRFEKAQVKVVDLRGSRVAAEDFDSFPESELQPCRRAVVEITRAPSGAPAVGGYFDNRIISYRSGTGRLAPQRAAKG